MKIRVRYCGGCNPQIDRASVVTHLVKIAQGAGFCVDLRSGDDADWLLLINGCPRACLEEEHPEVARERRCISVEGSHLGRRPVAEDELPGAVWEAFKDRLAPCIDMISPLRIKTHASRTV
ncbi:MAG: hypothetical protein AB1473_00910 [Thermodesulfobacteriota bacterium]